MRPTHETHITPRFKRSTLFPDHSPKYPENATFGQGVRKGLLLARIGGHNSTSTIGEDFTARGITLSILKIFFMYQRRERFDLLVTMGMSRIWIDEAKAPSY